jgi:hypothetical protein
MEVIHHSGHAIKMNHSQAIPRYIVSYATETVRNNVSGDRLSYHHRFSRGHVCIGRLAKGKIVGYREQAITDKLGLWEILRQLSKPSHTVWVVSHNCLRDLVVSGFSDMFEKGEVQIDKPRSKRTISPPGVDTRARGSLCVIESPPTIVGVKIGCTQGRVVFVDSLNWFDANVDTLLASLVRDKHKPGSGIPPIERGTGEAHTAARVIFHTFVKLIHWVKANDFGMFRYTTAAQAMACYRHRFMPRKILVHDNDGVKALERISYFGGRTEVFKLGRIGGCVYQLDCNSLFPAVMRRCHVPYCLHRSEHREDFIAFRQEIKWENSIAEVELDTDVAMYPCRTSKYIIYPKGKFKTVLVGPELHAAIVQGHVTRVGSWAEYKTAALFTDFVETLYRMRYEYQQSGDKLYATFAKKLMNSLYGKFAQMSAPWVNTDQMQHMLPWTLCRHYNESIHQYEYYRAFGWQVQKLTPRVEIKSTFVAISAFVTAHARMKMNWLRDKAGRRNVYYQGVDGMLLNREGFNRLDAANEIDNHCLGKLRLDAISDDCEILGCSDYRVGGKVVLAGRAAMYDDVDFGVMLQHKFTAATHLFKGCAADYYEERLEEWVRTGKYTKGVVDSQGWVEPLELGQIGGGGSGGANVESASACAST